MLITFTKVSYVIHPNWHLASHLDEATRLSRFRKSNLSWISEKFTR